MQFGISHFHDENHPTSLTRGHAFKLKKMSFQRDLRGKFFSLRVHNQWNALPRTVAEAPTLNAFKGRLDRFLSEQHYSTEMPLPVVRVTGVGLEETHEESD